MKQILYSILTLVFGSSLLFGQEKPIQNSAKETAVIVGSGPGALTSAVYLQRAGIDTLVIEGKTPGGAIAQSPTVHNWPGEVEIDGLSLVNKIRNQALANGARIVSQELVDIDTSSTTYKLTTRDVKDPTQLYTIETKACIIATGSMPRLLGVPGESGETGYWTKGVYSCAVCDGSLYKDKTVAVIGGGDSAITEANYLSNIAKKVYIILRSDQFKTVETLRMQELIKKNNVEVLYNTKIQEIAGDGHKVTHLNLSTKNQLDIDGVFIAIGAIPNTALFEKKIALDSSGYIKLHDGQKTSANGIFAIGDVVDPYYKQAISAAGDGAKAALQLEQYLTSLPKGEKVQETDKMQVVKTQASTTSPTIQDIPSKEAFYSMIGDGKGPVVFDFYSPYCSPCKDLLSQIEQASVDYKDKGRFYKVDVSQYSDLAETYNVYSVPTVLVFNSQGKLVAKATGLDDCVKLIKKLDSVLKK